MEVDKTVISGLINAAMSADYTAVRRFGRDIARQLASQGDHEGAKWIQSILRKRRVPLQSSGYAEALPRDNASRLPLIEEGQPLTTPVMLNDESSAIVTEFVNDAKHIHLLSEKGVSSRLGLLLYGPPGTGKSLIAGHVASLLSRPFYIARLDSLISSRLGETAKNIRSVFEYVPSKKAVLFLDEMDAIAKVRDDRHELGELKRVVNTVLQGLDSLTDDVITIAATNHPHLLDPAIWRRFPYKTEIDLPSADVRESLWLHFLYEDDETRRNEATLLSKVSDGLNGADIENIGLAARRRAILSGEEPLLVKILLAVLKSNSSSVRLISSDDPDTQEKKTVSILLNEKGGINQAEIARIVGVSRQMMNKYLKGVKNA